MEGKSLDISSPSWTRSVLSHDQAIKETKEKVRVYPDSVPCVGQMKQISDEKMGRSSGRTQDVSFSQRTVRNRWRSN